MITFRKNTKDLTLVSSNIAYKVVKMCKKAPFYSSIHFTKILMVVLANNTFALLLCKLFYARLLPAKQYF